MDMKEKLVELLYEADRNCNNKQCQTCKHQSKKFFCKIHFYIDHLIAHGVTVQELALPEQDYYVLRNTETGMYFRGKGVNRWGKYFNQATIYRVKGTAEHSIKEVAWHGEKAELVHIKIVEMPQPPKGE